LFSSIQGRISRTDQFGEIRLTETLYAPCSRLTDHVHEFGCFGFVLQGEFHEQFGAKTMDCNRSAVFFRPPQIVHRDRVDSCGARCFYVEISPVWLDHVRQYCSDLKCPSILDDVRMRCLASQLYIEWKQLDDVGPLAIEGLTFSMAAHLCRSLDSHGSHGRPRWLKRVIETIDARFQETLSLQELASEVSVHPVHLARQFRKYMGTSIGEFVRIRRVDFARRELSETDKPLVDIALESGFAQQAHFTTVFKRIAGTTPSQYRKLIRLH
jgi:AraC family transcriptional regulator